MSDTTVEAWHLARPRRRVGWRAVGHAIRLTLAAGLLTGAAVLTTMAIARLPSPVPAHPVSVPAAWIEINRPVHIYSLEAPILSAASLVYTARLHTLGGREDVLAWGRLDGGKPALRLRLFRRASEPADQRPLVAAVAHEAAQVGLSVVRSGVPYAIKTRFGPFEANDVTLAHPDGSAPTPCAAVRLVLGEPALSIGALGCGAFTRAQLGCVLERLDVAAARDDRALIDFFAASELRRNAACAGMRLGPDSLHAAWLDDPDDAVEGDKPATARRTLRRR